MQTAQSHKCRWAFFLSLFTAAALVLPLMSSAQEEGPGPDQVDQAVARGAEYLAGAQAEDGSFGMRSHPGITALCVYALENSESDKEAVQKAVQRGLENLRTFAQDDGSIQPPQHGIPVYTTAVSLLAFQAAGEKKDEKLIRKGREFLLNAQKSRTGPEGETQLGGFGYSNDARPDMSNTQWAMEALYQTRMYAREPLAEDPEGDAKAQDAAFQGALSFIESCQNSNKASENYGAVAYTPRENTGTQTGGEGEKAQTSQGDYAPMTYAAMKTMIYAEVDRGDPRVQSALDWIRRHFTFEENPGQGMNSYYYYIQTCAKALAALGAPQITDHEGNIHDWRREMRQALIERQRKDGSWVNTNGRHWENDPHLATAYSLLALLQTVAEED